MSEPANLRERLIAAMGGSDDDTLHRKLAALRADQCITVVAVWLRGEARELRQLAKDALDRHSRRSGHAESLKVRFLAQASVLESLADELSPPTEEQQCRH